MRHLEFFSAVVIAAGSLLAVAPSSGWAKPPSEKILIPGLQTSRLDSKLRGLVLLEELNCAACHATDSSFADTSKKAPRLTAVGARVNPYYLERFIQTPHAIKPGTTMPDVLSHLDVGEKKQAAQSITHFLLSLNKSQKFDLQATDAVAAERGEKLFHSVGCVACHAPRNAAGEESLTKTSAPLGSLEKKYNVSSLVNFLVAPHRVRPSGRMPDMRLPRRDVERIAHYLLRRTQVPGHLHYTMLRGRVWEGLEVNVEKEKSGHVDDFDLGSLRQVQGNSAIVYEGFLNVDAAGDHTFFLEMNGGELWINDIEVANLKPSSRRGVKKARAKVKLAAGWNKIKLVYIHAGKEPRLSLEIEGPGLKRQAIASSRLSISKTPIEPYRPYRVDAALAVRGKQAFAALGCVKCHDDVLRGEKTEPVKFPALAKLDTSQGCLSDGKGSWPRFNLSAAQKTLLRSALTVVETVKLNHREIINKSLVTFNCIACHDRAELGGVMPERNHLFIGAKKELGNQGRIPPPLTLVGAKLRKEWIADVMLRGARQRKYLATTMPQFGEANVGHLVDLFEKTDAVEPVKFRKINDIRETKRAGHKLMGTTGFSCIACHDFNGQKAGGPGAMEIIQSTRRLKKDWFYWFMLNPARFSPGTIMPTAWPGGHVFKKDILGGDAKRQIESLWVYLQDGTRARNPIGLSRKSPELRVADETVICRGRGNAGYRGIAVGYPERVSLAFDSQEMNLRMLWKGDFATSNEGRFSARGSDRIQFPQGIPFHRLKSLEDNWPYKRKTDYLFPQDHGYQFRGYYLDQEKRPTFMYRYGDVKVEEFFEGVLDEKKVAYFRRTFTFEAPKAQEKFYFRAASGSGISKKSDASFVVGRLNVTIKSDHLGIVRDGEPKELLIPLTLPQGKSTLTLEYKW
jgi:mono/diheme cytochrome c family protein